MFQYKCTWFCLKKDILYSYAICISDILYCFVDDTSHHLSDEIDGASLATSTPEKHESKKRHASCTHLSKTSRKKPKKYKPKILDESSKIKIHIGQASEFIPETPLKRSTPMQHSKRNYVKKNISKKVSVKKKRFEHVIDSSKDEVHGHQKKLLCKRALKFLEKETQAEQGCNLSKVCEGHNLNSKIDKKEEKRFVKHYQRRGSVKMGESFVHLGNPTISETQDSI